MIFFSKSLLYNAFNGHYCVALYLNMHCRNKIKFELKPLYSSTFQACADSEIHVIKYVCNFGASNIWSYLFLMPFGLLINLKLIFIYSEMSIHF